MSPLRAEITALIRETGPIGIDRYMALCLGHPLHGYYRTRDLFGPRGDFTTAPEISQMFGELIGIWAACVHQMMGAPDPLVLVELGPGRGTLMADALRALRTAAPDTRVVPHLVETSPPLRAAQERALAGTAAARQGAVRNEAVWHADVGSLPAGPAILVANEFFDCLPVRQFQRAGDAWHERVIGLGSGGALAFGLAPEPMAGLDAVAPDGALMSVPGAGLDLMRQLARRIRETGGALLVVDYGHARPGFGDTLQAVAHHRFADPLEAPGEADLTVHVDFSALAQAATAQGAAVHGPVEQRDFLLALGLRERAERLKARARPDHICAIDAALDRLTDAGARGMGRLFKVLAVGAPGLGSLPGFQVP